VNNGNLPVPKLPRNETQILLQTAEDSFPHDLCATCECFLAYLAQLRIDSEPADKDLFIPFKIARGEMQKCLGCDPCPPGDLYAAYMLKKQKSNLITI
jgi:hypothetical protein